MPATQQANNNPTGKGGFGDHPENRNPGGWKPEVTFSYQYKRFMNMPVKDFETWLDKSKDTMTVVEHLAYKRVLEAKNSLPDIKEITDRTEGKAAQNIQHTGKDGDPIETITSLTYMPKQLPDEYWKHGTSTDSADNNGQ